MAPVDRREGAGRGRDVDAQGGLERRILLLPTPSPGFDAVKADADDLRRYGLPPRPGAQAPPKVIELWEQAVAGPLDLPDIVWPGPIIDDYSLGYQGVTAGGRYESSRNWSGVSIAETGGNGFLQLWGSWYVPDVSPPAVDGEPAAADDYRCSTWIGLGGMRDCDNSLPQIGTTQALRIAPDGSERKDFHAWWQWWIKGTTKGPVRIPAVQVHAGDQIICVLTVQSSDLVLFFMKNETTGAPAFRLLVAAPAASIPLPIPILLPKVEATAEWITERPTKIGSTDLYPLPDYGSVQFESCFAAAGPDPSTPIYSRDLAGARIISMYEARQHPLRTAVISRARKKGETRAEMRYSGNVG